MWESSFLLPLLALEEVARKASKIPTSLCISKRQGIRCVIIRVGRFLHQSSGIRLHCMPFAWIPSTQSLPISTGPLDSFSNWSSFDVSVCRRTSIILENHICPPVLSLALVWLKKLHLFHFIFQFCS